MAKSINELQNENEALTQQLIASHKKVQELSNQSDPKLQELKKSLPDIKNALESYRVLQEKHEALKNESKNGIIDELKYLMDNLPKFIISVCSKEESIKEKLEILEIFPQFKPIIEKLNFYLDESCTFLSSLKTGACIKLEKACTDLLENNNRLEIYLSNNQSKSLILNDTNYIIEEFFKLSKEVCDNKNVIEQTLENFKGIKSIDPIIDKLDTYLDKYCDLSVSFENKVCTEIDTFCNYV